MRCSNISHNNKHNTLHNSIYSIYSNNSNNSMMNNFQTIQNVLPFSGSSTTYKQDTTHICPCIQAPHTTTTQGFFLSTFQTHHHQSLQLQQVAPSTLHMIPTVSIFSRLPNPTYGWWTGTPALLFLARPLGFQCHPSTAPPQMIQNTIFKFNTISLFNQPTTAHSATVSAHSATAYTQHTPSHLRGVTNSATFPVWN